MRILIVGCGGIGGWLTASMSRRIWGRACDEIFLVDADKVDERNIERQLFFVPDEVNQYKAAVLANRFRSAQCQITEVKYFIDAHAKEGFSRLGDEEPAEFNLWNMNIDVILCGVDNHAGRLACLAAADRIGIPCIIGANEDTTAEGYAYLPDWKNDPERDPRRYYTMHETAPGNPLKPGCTLSTNSQTSLANMMAASYVSWLFQLWIDKVPTKKSEAIVTYPWRVNNTFARIWANGGVK